MKFNFQVIIPLLIALFGVLATGRPIPYRTHEAAVDVKKSAPLEMDDCFVKDVIEVMPFVKNYITDILANTTLYPANSSAAVSPRAIPAIIDADIDSTLATALPAAKAVLDDIPTNSSSAQTQWTEKAGKTLLTDGLDATTPVAHAVVHLLASAIKQNHTTTANNTTTQAKTDLLSAATPVANDLRKLAEDGALDSPMGHEVLTHLRDPQVADAMGRVLDFVGPDNVLKVAGMANKVASGVYGGDVGFFNGFDNDGEEAEV